MELIIISDKKMKIMLSESELDRYNLDSENFSMENDAQRHAFRRILNEACRQSGFENKSARIMVQMYPGKKGGCEIFVTRIEEGERKKALSPSPISLDIDCSRSCDEVACYSFSCFTHLNTVCRQLLVSKFSGKSSAYISNDGTYYLVLSDFAPPSSDKPYGKLSFIGELARSTSIQALGYIEDYCKKIASPDAVSSLGKF